MIRLKSKIYKPPNTFESGIKPKERVSKILSIKKFIETSEFNSLFDHAVKDDSAGNKAD